MRSVLMATAALTPAAALPAFKLLIPASSPSGPPELRVHEGCDWLYVLSGRVRLLLGAAR